MKIWFKCCPHCLDGDLQENKDEYGPYVACIQCGHYLSKAEEVLNRVTCLQRAQRSAIIHNHATRALSAHMSWEEASTS